MPKIIKLEDKEIVAFCHESEDWGLFSNSAATPINMQTPAGEKLFPTVTHYFQYMKDPSDTTYMDAILACNTAAKAINLGVAHFKEVLEKNRAHALVIKADWQVKGGCDKAMDAAINAKLEQHAEVKQTLMQTENTCIIFDTGSMNTQDGTWGLRSGGKKTAYVPPEGVTTLPPGNKLGILWMQKRNVIFKAASINDFVIEDPAAFSETVRQVMESKLPTTYLLDPTVKLPSREVTALKTVITKSATSSTETSSGALNDPARISALIIELNKEGGSWKVDTAKSTEGGDQVITDGAHHFTVTKDSMSTTDADLATFRAILKSFTFLYPDEKPKITVSNAMLENLWKKACEELHIEAEIVLTATPVTAQAETEEETHDQTPSSRPV